MISKLINMRYEILERVGEGTFFQVCKTRDRVTGRVVVVKQLLPAYTADRGFREALIKSLSALTDLSHPNIAGVFEVGEDDGVPFLVTEFVRGINLKDRIRRIAPFTLSVAVDFAIAVGEALQLAHGRGIVHGDVRAQNVIVSPEGAVKLTDFGIAQALAASPAAWMANQDRAAAYQAPEVVSGAPASIASDLYGLGVILFEMLTGGLPYPGDTPRAITDRLSSDPVPSPRSLNPGIPRSLEGITMKALQKRPEDRYRQASDLLSDLKTVRDALRFGKPLSWSPIEAVGAQPPASADSPPSGSKARGQAAERWPEAATPTGVPRMSAAVAPDDRVSPILKIMLGTVIFIIMFAGVVGVAVWMAVMAKPPEQNFPDLVGKTIDQARAIADKANVRLLEHDEFKDGYDPGVIFRADWEPGRAIRPGRSIPVWVSKGSRMVWVPNLVRGTSQDAETKLKTAGLTLGQVDRQFDPVIPYGEVLRQNPRAGKRVERDLAVNMTISDGPKPEPDTPNANDNSGSTAPDVGGTPNGIGGGDTGNPTDTGSDNTTADTSPTAYTLKITVKPDGRGPRNVRVEYDDLHGTHTPIDEMHNERDVIQRRLDVYGSQMTIRVYYGGDATPAAEQTIPLKRGGSQ